MAAATATMQLTTDKLLLLFERPREPICTPKGHDHQVLDVPEEYLDDRYRLRSDLNTAGRVQVPAAHLPDLSLPLSLAVDSTFSLFVPLHRLMAANLISVLMEVDDADRLWSLLAFCRSRLQPGLFNYGASVVALHHPLTAAAAIPPLFTAFPDKFFDGAVLAKVRQESAIANGVLTLGNGSETSIVQSANLTVTTSIVVPPTASDLDPEHRLAYFREDLGVNLHHWHWHLVYPSAGPRQLVAKDRRGELFYYMHSQILARYNTERLCNKLARTRRLQRLRDSIPEAYFPKLDAALASRAWPGRPAGAAMQDISRPQEEMYFDIEDLERWRDRLYDAVHQGAIITSSGERVTLDEVTGIDVLADLVESSDLSVNSNYYGDLHNALHNAMAAVHDPDYRHLEGLGVMGDPATAMRDPVFYRVHMTIEDIFQDYKATLKPYTEDQLDFPGITVTDVRVQVPGRATGELVTFWQRSDVSLSKGLDFSPRGDVTVTIMHLQHDDFTYSIQVNNDIGSPADVTVRIFLAPKLDERGNSMFLREQRRLFIELDRFTATVEAGEQTLTRDSRESSVTIPWERTFRPMDHLSSQETYNYCGCGWPHHMLIPKGTREGYACELVVLVTDLTFDKVPQENPDPPCADAMSYCGLRNNKWPDTRAMGFPFDREPRVGADRLEKFVTPNMAVMEITVLHEGERT